MPISTSYLREYAYKSKAVLSVTRALWVSLNGTLFTGNYVVDDVEPRGAADDLYAR